MAHPLDLFGEGGLEEQGLRGSVQVLRGHEELGGLSRLVTESLRQ